MKADQLQQLLGVIRVGGGGGHKTAKFKSSKGTEWRIRRRNFEQTVQINGWANERQQREAAAAMEVTAAKFMSNIPAYVAGRAIADMLALYESRFLPAAAGQLGAAQFQTAAQMDSEQIAVWHARLRNIFERAFPGENIQGSRLLINKFVLKLADFNIRQWTHRANPATYNAAMTAASNEAASQSILAHEARTGGKSNIAINAFGGRRGACHGCSSYEHHIRECPLARPDLYRDENKLRGRGQPRGGRGGCRHGGGSRDTGGGGGGFKQTYLQTREGGTRGAPSRRRFGNNNNRNGGVNGMGGEDEQYDEYCDKLQGYDNTPSLNNVNGELDQENY
jgi:hypothetical protein